MKIEKENINALYKNSFEEEVKKIKKTLIKTIGDKLTQEKAKYNNFYKENEKTIMSKFNELSDFIMKSKANINGSQNPNISLLDNKNIHNIDNNTRNNMMNNNNLEGKQINKMNNQMNLFYNNENKINNNLNNINNNANQIQNIIKEEKIYKNEGNNVMANNKNNIKDLNINNNMNDNIIKNINNDTLEDKGYSFDCTNSIFLSVYIYRGTNEAKFEIYLKNTGTKAWDKDTKLILDRSSDCLSDEIKLDPQKPNEERSYKVTIRDLRDCTIGEYKVVFKFCSGGKIYGDNITAMVKIIEKDNKNEEITENLDKIQEFRDTFNLSEDDYSNERILEILKDNDYNFENAFSSLFN